ncbi:MAG: hypothetical protein WCF26_02315 [Candidatus Sulfotelmatobacter sp.]
MIDDKRRTGVQYLVLTIAFCLLASLGSLAQQTQPGTVPDAPVAGAAPTQTAPQRSNPVESGKAFFQLLQRKSVVFPDLATNEASLNRWQKFQLAANNSVSVATFGTALIASGLSQAVESPPGFGQEWGGYGKRFGADMARSASNNFFGTFLIASTLRQDPRFYVRKNLSFTQSVKYAAVRLVITRSDSGEQAVNYSGMLGTLASEALANTYYPEANRGVRSIFVRYASDMGWRLAGNMLRQYWPKINRRLKLLPAD